MTIAEIDSLIVSYENKIAALREERAKAVADEQATEAYKNAEEAFFDGIKYIADYDHPLPLTLPMAVRANMYYSKFDGLKTSKYVAVASGIANEENFADFFEFVDW